MSDYEKREIIYYANTKDPDQSAHLHTLIRFNRFYSNQCFFSYTVKDGALFAHIP